MLLAELVDAVAECFPADDGAEVAVLLPFFPVAVERGEDAAFEVDGPAFVQPEVLPTTVGNQVTGPRVGEFVGDDVDVLAVAGDEGGCGELDREVVSIIRSWFYTSENAYSILRILHPTIRERGWEYKDVVSCPRIRIHDALRRLNERLHIIFKLPLTTLQLLGSGPDSTPRPYRSTSKVA
jgi:hypothetical protein